MRNNASSEFFILQPLFSCISRIFCFCYNFWFLQILSLVITFGFSFFFCNFIYTENLYKPQSVQTCNQLTSLHVGNRQGRQFPRSFLFSHFLSFSILFSATKHSSEDDNSEAGWLDLFLLEEEACWLGCGGN